MVDNSNILIGLASIGFGVVLLTRGTSLGDSAGIVSIIVGLQTIWRGYSNPDQ
jgi:hypothetical protein